MTKQITIGSRGSKLALIQSNEVKAFLQEVYPYLDIRIRIIKTKGDKILDKPLIEIGGKGLFTAELEDALIGHQIDLAVHSLKDLPSILDKGLKYVGSPKMGDARDAFISTKWDSINDLPQGGSIATGSVRRKAQLLGVRPDLEIHNLRGNIDTRLIKLNDNKLGGIIVAASAMHRLNLHGSITEYLNPSIHVPSAGQGALGLEIAADRDDIDLLVQPIIHSDTTLCCIAQRTLLHQLAGGCSAPIGCYSQLQEDKLSITGYMSNAEGLKKILKTIKGNSSNSISMANQLAEEMLKLESEKNYSI